MSAREQIVLTDADAATVREALNAAAIDCFIRAEAIRKKGGPVPAKMAAGEVARALRFGELADRLRGA